MMTHKNVRNRIQDAEQVITDEMEVYRRWLCSHDLETMQALMRTIFYGSQRVQDEQERIDKLTGGIRELMPDDWEVVYAMYRQAPAKVVEIILKYELPHPEGVFEGECTEQFANAE